jgi:hypothetical protein
MLLSSRPDMPLCAVREAQTLTGPDATLGTSRGGRSSVATDRKRIPGEKNPVGDTTPADQIANAAMSSQMQGLSTGSGVLGGLLGVLEARRVRKAKKKAIALCEAEHEDDQR